MKTVATLVGLLLAFAVLAQETPRYKVTIKDGKAVVGAALLPTDPKPRIQPMHSSANAFGLSIEGRRITCSQEGSVWSSLKVDDSISDPFNEPEFAGRPGRNLAPKQLPPTASGRKRIGTQSTWKHQNVHVTQIIEIIASKAPANAKAGQKRLHDTCRITYIVENKGTVAHKVALKTSIDILINQNDGALYASPTTEPGKILNGVRLEGKSLPEYIWVVERADYNNPGMVATMTFKHARGENPNKVVLSNLGLVANFQTWDVPAQPAGDSACAIFWEEKVLQPGQKRELVWGYGGGVSTSAEAEGRVSIGLSGSFEPGKLFTIAAEVDDPLPDQVLALELPDGMERVEGRAIQPVAASSEASASVVLWKGRVLRPGDYEIRVRSSSGSVVSKQVTIEK